MKRKTSTTARDELAQAVAAATRQQRAQIETPPAPVAPPAADAPAVPVVTSTASAAPAAPPAAPAAPDATPGFPNRNDAVPPFSLSARVGDVLDIADIENDLKVRHRITRRVNRSTVLLFGLSMLKDALKAEPQKTAEAFRKYLNSRFD